MIKSILLTSFFMAFAFIAMPVTSAQACATCGCAGAKAHAHPHAGDHAKKPCTKCAAAGKACECSKGKKKPCEKTLSEKAPCTKCAAAGKPCGCDKKGKVKPCEKKMGEKKPCEKTLGKKEPCEKTLGKNAMKKHHAAPVSTTDHSAKGSFTFKSKSTFSSKGSAKYN